MRRLMFAGFKYAIASISILFTLTACTQTTVEETRFNGAVTEIGNGVIESYAEVDSDGMPISIGVTFSEEAFEQLPEILTDGHRCADLNDDEMIEDDTECLPWHERVLPLPADISRRDDMPFKWVLLNWNPQGHIPEGVWNSPHFDIHFYMESIENVFALMPGTCGPERMRCDQYEIATRPVPSNYIHEDFQDVGAAAPAMGNHLIDPTGPEFEGEPFTRSWIFGAYDGRIIFYEEMLSIDYLTSEPNECFPIKSPPAVDTSGYYPAVVCSQYDQANSTMSVSLEEFSHREAK